MRDYIEALLAGLEEEEASEEAAELVEALKNENL